MSARLEFSRLLRITGTIRPRRNARITKMTTISIQVNPRRVRFFGMGAISFLLILMRKYFCLLVGLH